MACAHREVGASTARLAGWHYRRWRQRATL